MFCGVCGTRNSRNNKFCRECGTRLEPPAPVQPLPEEAFEDLREPSPPADDSEQVRGWLEEAFQAYEQGRLEEARERCYQVLGRHPESTSAHSLLALIYENQGDIPRAIREYQIVLEINPDSPADRASLARLLGETEKGPERGPSLPLWNRLRQVPVWAWVAGGVGLVLLCSSLIAWESHRRGTAVAKSEGTLPAIRPLPALASPEAPGAAAPTVPAPAEAAGPAGAASASQAAAPLAASAAPSLPSRPSRPPLNRTGAEGRPTSPRRPPAVPAGPLPSPVLSRSGTVFPAPVEAIPLETQSSSVAFFPTNPSGPSPEVPPTPVASEPSPPPPPKKEEPHIRITVKEAPAPRRTEPAHRPEPAPRTPASEGQPAAAKRDLRAEAEALEARALRLSSQGDYQGAIQAYRQALETAPDSPRAGQIQQGIGLCYQKLQQHRQALSALKKAEQKLAQQAAQGGADRLTQRALQSTREAIKASEAYLQEGTESSSAP
jgi:tetratricopeptide (TPR) repeat protein